MKRIWAVALAMSLASGAAFSQSPALTTDWVPMSLSQDDCLARAERVVRNIPLIRIERVRNSVFADTADKQNQVVIRCVSDKQMAIFVAAGRQGDDQITARWVARLLEAFDSR